MAELLLSALLPVIFDKLASAAVNKIASYKGIDVEVIKKWKRSLTQIQNVLADASQKEITSPAVERWLKDLHHLAYDMDDVLDGWATEAMHPELTHESEAFTSKVRRKLIPSCCTNFSRSTTMHDKLDSINGRLEDLTKEKDTLGLRPEEETRPKNKNRKLQTSIVNASGIIGRGAVKDALVHRLLGDEPCDENFTIVPIVGMGGVGKTTLARLLYDDEHVKDHFKLRAWVCVSDEFDSFGISKIIFQSVARENKEFADLNLLQEDLVKHLSGKRFLLVLDDVWSESYDDWKTLVGPFHKCARGSKIIITTRKEKLLNKLGYKHLNPLQSLSHDDALSLFAIHALGEKNFDSHLSLKPYGEGIVKKCDGLPLALIALGTSLRTKEDEDSWKGVLGSEIWRSKDDEILPALKLSYQDLSAHLKQLFAYCSLFPKDFLFDKEELVLLWMAEGFLNQSPLIDSTEECMGHKEFDELLLRSFFQHAPDNESLFVMHDMMNDLATFVASEFFLRLDMEHKKDIRIEMVETYRHMSFIREKYVTYDKLESVQSAKSLRTFLATSVGVVDEWKYFCLSNKILVDLLPELPLLRVLSLSNFRISEVPESIGTLRHLRYLNLSRTEITCLPENVCNLYNLQTLIVFSCRQLVELPNNFVNLKKMRHLDIRDTPLLNQLPLRIDGMRSLQTLSKIIVGGERGFEIGKLKDLKNLRGKISIMGLDKVQKAINAREANFSQKSISELEVQWSDVFDGSRNEDLEKEVLKELKPRNDKLIHLKIGSYGGLQFPVWVGDPSFILLKHVSIRGCKRCESLPPLGQLPLIKELFIEGLNRVKVVGMELLGSGGAFHSLEILKFKNMCGWEEWSMKSGVVFPHLQQLHIEDCPNLSEISVAALPSLNTLRIVECDSRVLRRLVEVAPAVTKLDIREILELNDVVWRGVIEYLGAVEELIIMGCKDLRYLWESEGEASKVLVKLRRLQVWSCHNLVSLVEKEEVDHRSNLIPSLRRLDVFNCSVSSCDRLFERGLGGQNMLEDVDISKWPNLKSITELSYLVHLTTLWIYNCESLESFPDKELPNLTSLKTLTIERCKRMDACFPRGFWPPNLRSLTIGELKKPISEWGSQNFPPSLVELELYGGEDDGVSSSSQISQLLPSSLTSLRFHKFEKLESFSMTGLQHLQSLDFNNCPNLNELSYPHPHPHPQHLTSLQHLFFASCPNMMNLPQVLLPSLLSLNIYGGCPNLKERCSKRGCYRPFISHIPDLTPWN